MIVLLLVCKIICELLDEVNKNSSFFYFKLVVDLEKGFRVIFFFFFF